MTDGMTMVVGLPLTDKSRGSSRNAVSQWLCTSARSYEQSS
jgi:hypothetical protein